MRVRCTNKTAFGETGFQCQFVFVHENTSEAAIAGNVSISMEGNAMQKFAVRGEYDITDIPAFPEVPVPAAE